jgi:hypothetical protein
MGTGALPTNDESVAEIHNPGDDFVGYPSYPQNFTGVKERNGDGSWSSYCWSGNSCPDYWKWVVIKHDENASRSICFAQQAEVNSNTKFQVWTYPYHRPSPDSCS